MTTNAQKIMALAHFESALAAGDKHFQLKLIDKDTVELTDLEGGATKNINIALDNVPAMLYDILRQGGDWIM